MQLWQVPIFELTVSSDSLLSGAVSVETTGGTTGSGSLSSAKTGTVSLKSAGMYPYVQLFAALSKLYTSVFSEPVIDTHFTRYLLQVQE